MDWLIWLMHISKCGCLLFLQLKPLKSSRPLLVHAQTTPTTMPKPLQQLRIWVNRVPGLEDQPQPPGRWLFPTELLLAQAFPCHPSFHKDWQVSPFNFARPDRKARQVSAQAGNSMSVLCTFLCALHSLTCLRAPQSPDRTIDRHGWA